MFFGIHGVWANAHLEFVLGIWVVVVIDGLRRAPMYN